MQLLELLAAAIDYKNINPPSELDFDLSLTITSRSWVLEVSDCVLDSLVR
jgi:hypothetical protein